MKIAKTKIVFDIYKKKQGKSRLAYTLKFRMTK